MASQTTNPLLTPQGILSFVNVFMARQFTPKGMTASPDAPYKYSCDIIVDKQDPQIQAILQEHQQLKLSAFPNGMQPTQYGFEAFRDGDLMLKDGLPDPMYTGKFVIKGSQDQAFGDVQILGIDNKPVFNPIKAQTAFPPMQYDPNIHSTTQMDDVYSGAIGRMYIQYYAFKGGSGGIGCKLIAVKVDGAGERIGGGHIDATGVFDAPPTPVATPMQQQTPQAPTAPMQQSPMQQAPADPYEDDIPF